jgi:hypothetical protein
MMLTFRHGGPLIYIVVPAPVAGWSEAQSGIALKAYWLAVTLAERL